MRKPRIGVIPYDRADNPYRQYIPARYAQAVERAGGEWVFIPYFIDHTALPGLMDTLDGLLMSGGPDVHPRLYGQDIEPDCGRIVDVRDRLELRLMELAAARDMPVLGICRGVQLINVALGGTLIQHIPAYNGDVHQQKRDRPFSHAVDIVPGTQLHALVGAERLMTNSYHHQAIRDLAPGLIASAHGPKGLIEAAEAPGWRFLMGLQWHPEMTLDDDDVSIRFFKRLIELC